MRLLALIVFVPVVAWAQDERADAGVEVAAAPVDAGTPAPVAIVAMPPCPASSTALPQPTRDCIESAPVSRWLRVARLGVELVLGTGLGAIGELSGGYIGFNVDVLSGHDAGPGTAVGTMIGATLGVAPGVWLGGRTMGGDGSWGWTFLGSALGSGLGAGVLAAKNSYPFLIIAAALPLIGAMLGYELSSHDQRAPDRPAGIWVMPSIGVNSVGLVGAF